MCDTFGLCNEGRDQCPLAVILLGFHQTAYPFPFEVTIVATRNVRHFRQQVTTETRFVVSYSASSRLFTYLFDQEIIVKNFHEWSTEFVRDIPTRLMCMRSIGVTRGNVHYEHSLFKHWARVKKF